MYTDRLFEVERAGVTAASRELGSLLCLRSNIRDQVRRPICQFRKTATLQGCSHHYTNDKKHCGDVSE